MHRQTTLLQLRLHIHTIAESSESSALEMFQNKTLRPILKLQNQVLVESFKGLNLLKMGAYPRLDGSQKRIWVRNILSKEAITRNVMIGIVLGMMTQEELRFSLTMRKNADSESWIWWQRGWQCNYSIDFLNNIHIKIDIKLFLL